MIDLRALLVFVVLTSGCHCVSCPGPEPRTEPPVFTYGPVTFLGCRSFTEAIHRIEFRAPDDQVVWRLDADPPVRTDDLALCYGEVPAGFRQVRPRAGAPRPLDQLPRGTVIVYGEVYVRAGTFARDPAGRLTGSWWIGDGPYPR